MPKDYEAPAEELRYEGDPVKGSRFLASIAPIADEEEALAFVQRIRKEGPSATHHCWAYRIARPTERFRFSDDGEPGGSAGRPILQQIEGHGLHDICCVVTRYYGGTKLGVGGLIRAYGGCAAKALDLVARKVQRVMVRLDVRFPYDCTSAVQGFLSSQSHEPIESDYGASVHLAFVVPLPDAERFENELRERTAARAQIERGEPG